MIALIDRFMTLLGSAFAPSLSLSAAHPKG
jgi:hypothetical protein